MSDLTSYFLSKKKLNNPPSNPARPVPIMVRVWLLVSQITTLITGQLMYRSGTPPNQASSKVALTYTKPDIAILLAVGLGYLRFESVSGWNKRSQFEYGLCLGWGVGQLEPTHPEPKSNIIVVFFFFHNINAYLDSRKKVFLKIFWVVFPFYFN